MIKKLTACLLSCLLLAGCAAGQEEQGFSMWLELETAQEVWGISYEYTAAGETLSGAGIVNADGSRLKAGDLVMLQFLPEDFPAGRIPERFQVQIYLVDHRGVKTAAGSPVMVWLTGDNGCRIRLTGSEPEGYFLTRIK